MELYITTRKTRIPTHNVTWMKLTSTSVYGRSQKVGIIYVKFKGTKLIWYKGSEQHWSWEFLSWMQMAGL